MKGKLNFNIIRYRYVFGHKERLLAILLLAILL